MKIQWKYTLLILPLGLSSCMEQTQGLFSGPPGITLPSFQTGGGQNAANTPTLTAQGGETLTQLALRHGMDPQTLSSLNNMSMQTVLRSGQQIAIPTATAVAGSYVDMAQDDQGDLPTVRDSQTAQSTWDSGPGTQAYVNETAGSTTNVAQVQPKPEPVQPKPVTPAPTPTPTVNSKKGNYTWPVNGKVTKSYSSSDPSIVIAAPPSTAVKAAESGTVIHAGDVTNYGNTVLVRHSDGKLSLYGYNDSLLVKKGDTVSKGQVISRVGESGNATSPSLIYELRNKDGKTYENPSDYFQ